MSVFLDTSALAKIYHREAGTSYMHHLYHAQEVIYLSDLARVEFRAMLLRRYREGGLSDEALQAVLARFAIDLSDRYQTIGFTAFVVEEALRLLDTLGRTTALRSLDAIQFAFYTTFCEEDVSFITADRRLLDAVASAGFPVKNPTDE